MRIVVKLKCHSCYIKQTKTTQSILGSSYRDSTDWSGQAIILYYHSYYDYYNYSVVTLQQNNTKLQSQHTIIITHEIHHNIIFNITWGEDIEPPNQTHLRSSERAQRSLSQQSLAQRSLAHSGDFKLNLEFHSLVLSLYLVTY